MTKRWRCLVCNYIHEGDEPPEACPLCGADRSQFVLVEEPAATQPLHHGLKSAALHLHPVLAHFPNGLMPTAWLFLILYYLTGRSSFEEGALWLVMVVVAAAPPALASGIFNWHRRYGGRRAAIFTQKIVLTVVLMLIGVVAISLRLLTPAPWHTPAYYLCLAAMLACVTMLGYLGGKLVFSYTGGKK